MTVLLDSSVLVAAAFRDHVHNAAADHWLAATGEGVATCPITQGALVRIALRQDFTAADALALLAQLTASGRHEFWSDDIGLDRWTCAACSATARSPMPIWLSWLDIDGGVSRPSIVGLAAHHNDVAEPVPTA